MSHDVTLSEAIRVWLRVAALSFGGPAGQIAVMHRIIVEEKRWVDERRFLHALNFCMVLPGPEAQQLATYLGWLMHRHVGGVVAGLLFILPGAVSIMALSIVYVLFGAVGVVSSIFFGLKAAVLAVVLQAVLRLGTRALRNRASIGLAAASFLGIFVFSVPFPLIVLGSGLIGFVASRHGFGAFGADSQTGHAGSRAGDAAAAIAERRTLLGEDQPAPARPAIRTALRVAAVCMALWLGPVVLLRLLLGPAHILSQIATFFSTMAAVTFGGAYAILAYVAQQAVETYHWLTPGEMLDGLGLAETTPGPLIMALQFVGFVGAYRDPGALSPLGAGMLGGILTTWVTFVPSFMFVLIGAPFIESLRGNEAIRGALSAITAAVVGVILNLTVWFAIHTTFRETRAVRGYGAAFDIPILASVDIRALALSAAAIVAMLGFRLGMLPVLAACSAAGIALHLAGLIG